jgi:hypothetical protein
MNTGDTASQGGADGKGPWNGDGVRIEPGRIFRVNFPDPIGLHTAVVVTVRPDYVEVIYGVSAPGSAHQHVIRYGSAEARPFGTWIRNDTHFRVDNVAIVHVSLIGAYVGRVLAVPTQVSLEEIAHKARLSGKVKDVRPPVQAPEGSLQVVDK